MGGEGKSRKRRSSPSPEEEERSRKREDRESGRSSRDDREEHSKKKKHSKTDKSKERDSKDKHKRSRRDGDTDFKEISKDDYYSKNNEFATWLKEEKGKYFSDLSSESARDLFSSFVKEWNKGKLPSRYYEGIGSGPRSAHKWNIKT